MRNVAFAFAVLLENRPGRFLMAPFFALRRGGHGCTRLAGERAREASGECPRRHYAALPYAATVGDDGPKEMTWTICFFVKDGKNWVIHHEIVIVDDAKVPARERAHMITERLNRLYEEYPLGEYDVFQQTFTSVESLYRSWPELKPPSNDPG